MRRRRRAASRTQKRVELFFGVIFAMTRTLKIRVDNKKRWRESRKHAKTTQTQSCIRINAHTILKDNKTSGSARAQKQMSQTAKIRKGADARRAAARARNKACSRQANGRGGRRRRELRSFACVNSLKSACRRSQRQLRSQAEQQHARAHARAPLPPPLPRWPAAAPLSSLDRGVSPFAAAAAVAPLAHRPAVVAAAVAAARRSGRRRRPLSICKRRSLPAATALNARASLSLAVVELNAFAFFCFVF